MRKVSGKNHTNPTAINQQSDVNHKLNLHLKEGSLHSDMGIKAGNHISGGALSKEKAHAKKSGDVKLEEKVQFAINARKWHH